MTEQFPNLMKTISHRYKNFNKLQTQETWEKRMKKTLSSTNLKPLVKKKC
jgi:hypothetical protein